jgi:hypothetical protein
MNKYIFYKENMTLSLIIEKGKLTMPQSVIVAAASVREYFQEVVQTALHQHTYRPSEAASSYLVDLLCDNAHSPDSCLNGALAPVMAEAQLDLPSQSVRKLKMVGDQSLYVAGFFSDSLRRSQLDPSYYVVLGGTAYRKLSGILRRLSTDTTLVVVYSELAHEFSRFVEVLNEVKEIAGITTSDASSLGELYEEWLRTGSTGAAKKLRAAGIMVLRRVPIH